MSCYCCCYSLGLREIATQGCCCCCCYCSIDLWMDSDCYWSFSFICATMTVSTSLSWVTADFATAKTMTANDTVAALLSNSVGTKKTIFYHRSWLTTQGSTADHLAARRSSLQWTLSSSTALLWFAPNTAAWTPSCRACYPKSSRCSPAIACSSLRLRAQSRNHTRSRPTRDSIPHADCRERSSRSCPKV